MIYEIKQDEGSFLDYSKIDRTYHYPDDKIKIEKRFFAFSNGKSEYAYLRCQELHGGKAVIMHLSVADWLPSLLDSLQVDFGELLQRYSATKRWYVGGSNQVTGQGWVSFLASFLHLTVIDRPNFLLELHYV